MNVLDLFSGIGGFSLGLERAGMRTVAFCEIDPFCRRVLAKHWPDVPIYEDVRQLRGEQVGSVDVICGGFPCQDISSAGNRTGIAGERSGLWSEFARLIREIRPKFVIVENVADLRIRGLGRVLGDLAEIGYDAEWECVPAAAVGSRQIRERLFVVAAPGTLDDANSVFARCEFGPPAGYGKEDGWWCETDRKRPRFGWGTWSGEPDVARVAYGVPDRTHRLRALGNAVVPQIPEIIGKAIMRAA